MNTDTTPRRSRRRVLLALAALLITATGGAALLASCLSLDRDPNALAVGTAAPRVHLVGADGQPFDLGTIQAKGLPVLVFYRGRW